MSNRPHERYAKVVFDENWLEQFISDVLETPIDVCYSKSEFMGDKGKRGAFFYALNRYADMSVSRICNRYAQSPESVKKIMASFTSGSYADKRDRIRDRLSVYMPLRQFETYKD